ncbi:hypothetical protein HDU97_001586 [Phlyctochytrium planicorne]|nr:hypothetical protein HDU97_001586 [Phlyctochytrium planicorne]
MLIATVIALLAIVHNASGLAAGGTPNGLKFRGRKWNYSPVIDAEYSNGDFVQIKGACSEDDAALQINSNFAVEYWCTLSLIKIRFKIDCHLIFWFRITDRFNPKEMFMGAKVPHVFSMAQEFNFHHFAVVNDNYNITMYLNGEPIINMFCPVPFYLPPVWSLGIRDWSTDIAKLNQLSPIFALPGEVAEFRVWSRPLSQAEIISKMYRTLKPSEIQDKNLMLYLGGNLFTHLNNVTDGFIINDKSNTKRFKGFMGGVLGYEINAPEIVASSAPIVNISTPLVRVTMKESGDYPSTVQIPLNAIEDVTTNLPISSAAGTSTTYTILTLPDPQVITLSSQSKAGTVSLNSVPSNVGSTWNVFATHKVNNSVVNWPNQNFTVSVTFGSTTVTVPVSITILKNAAPIIGDTGGAVIPDTVPLSVSRKPLTIPKFAWKNATYNTPITWEYWFVSTEDGRYMNQEALSYTAAGRINTEINKNLVMDYGWDYDGSGRTTYSLRKKFGLWSHVAMTSTGKGGVQNLYFNGQLVAQSPGNIALRPDNGPQLSNATGFITNELSGNIAVDEFRIWNVARSADEIKAGMFTSFTGKEKGLYLYHNFDTYSVQPDGSYIFPDLGPNGFDLLCTGYNSLSGCPLARSMVPIGGIVKDLSFDDGANTTLWNPAGQDLDDDTAYLRFVVDVLPTDAKMFAERNQTNRCDDGDLHNGISNPMYTSPVSAGSYIRKMQFVPAVQIVPSPNGGGNPYDSFKYHVTDGLRNSKTVTVQIYRKCWPGTYLDQSQRRCLPCNPGFYSVGYGYNPTCLPCPAGSSQPLPGSSSCIPCSQAVFISMQASVNGTAVNVNGNTMSGNSTSLPSQVIGIDDIASFGTYQESSGQSICKACSSLTYALRTGSTSCEGRAFIPKYISLGGSADSYPMVQGMQWAAISGSSSFRSVLDPMVRTGDVVSAIKDAKIIDAPKAVVVTGVLIAGLTFLCMIGIFLFVNDPVIKAASPPALSITAFGIIAGSLSVITYSVEPSKASCISEIWMIPVSFSIVIGMLISKTFRILRIFNNPRALKIRMTNWDLFGYMVAAAAGNVAILIIWSVYDPPLPSVFSRGSSEGLNFIYCSSKSSAAQSGFTAVLYIYNAFILCILAILAFMTRSVNALFSESKFIGYFVAATCGAVALFIPILYFLTNDVGAMYIIKSIAVLIVCAAAFVNLIAIKFYSIFRNRQQTESGVNSSKTNSMLGTSSALNATTAKNSTSFAAIYQQVLKANPNNLVAQCVFPTKKMGVVFWNAKIVILSPENKLIYILSPEPATEKKGPVTIPETLIFPLTKFSFKTPDSGSSMASSTTNGKNSETESNVSATGGSVPVLLITHEELKYTITLQFESAQIRKEWQAVLSTLGGDGKKTAAAPAQPKTSIATAAME